MQKQFEKGLSGKCRAFCITENLLKHQEVALGKRKTIWNVCSFLNKTFFFFHFLFIFCLGYNGQLSLSEISCYSVSAHSTERHLLLLKTIRPNSTNRKVISARYMEGKSKLTNEISRTIYLSLFNRIIVCLESLFCSLKFPNAVQHQLHSNSCKYLWPF